MTNLYLLINFFSILFPLAYSFDRRVRYFTRWKYLFPALLIPAIFFIAWDIFFTSIGVWGFNPIYLTGITIFNLPLEEVLFFFCIPFASIFIYDVVKYFKKAFSPRVSSRISIAIIIISLGAVVIYHDQLYPLVTFLLVAAFVFVMQFVLKSDFLGRFYLSYLYILIPFLIVNGLLTGSFIHEEVVWYNSAEIMGIRVNTIPVEDAFYGMLLLMMNVALYEGFMKKAKF
jgi:lycopene cyclase domain-containing protein